MGEVVLKLSKVDVLQVLDALESRRDAWQNTLEYLESENYQDHFGIIEECSDPAEARRIVGHYTDIISSVNNQVYG